MFFIRFTFKPSKAETYIIKWKPVTELDFTSDHIIVYQKVPGEFNTIDLAIDNPDIDWYVEVQGVCALNALTNKKTVRVPAVCRKVGLTATYSPDECSIINDLEMSTI